MLFPFRFRVRARTPDEPRFGEIAVALEAIIIVVDFKFNAVVLHVHLDVEVLDRDLHLLLLIGPTAPTPRV